HSRRREVGLRRRRPDPGGQPVHPVRQHREGPAPVVERGRPEIGRRTAGRRVRRRAALARRPRGDRGVRCAHGGRAGQRRPGHPDAGIVIGPGLIGPDRSDRIDRTGAAIRRAARPTWLYRLLMTTTVDARLARLSTPALALFRIIIGLLFALHGAMKLFGWPHGESVPVGTWPVWWAGLIEL